MDRQQILNLHEWQPGVCFRHPGKGQVVTAHVETIRPPAGGIQDVRACEECVLEMATHKDGGANEAAPPN